MAMTLQQARMRALQLRSERPELQSMAVDDLIAQVMATEGMGAPGAGGGGLANLFPPKTLTPSSPAPMMAARLAAPKPTADIVPGAGADSFRRAQQVRERTDRGPAPEERAAANANRQALVAEVRAAPEARAPEAAAAAPVREAAPVAVAEAAPKATYSSRYRPRLEQKQAELEQLKANVPAIGEVPPQIAYDLKLLSAEVSQLQGLVAAEEGAAVDADRAAILERQTKRLGREEELIEQARKRAPFDALIAAGAALGSARPGESFTSALTRGLQAGSESYTGARDTREQSRRGIEERRDALALQSIDAVQKARDEAIALQNAGAAMTEQQIRLAGMTQEGATNLALAPFKLRVGKAEASEAETKAETARETIDAENTLKRAQALYYQAGGGRGGGGGDGKPMTENQLQTKVSGLRKERRGLMIELNSPTTVGAEKAAIKLAIKYIDDELGQLGGTRTSAAPAAGNKTRTYNPKTGKLE